MTDNDTRRALLESLLAQQGNVPQVEYSPGKAAAFDRWMAQGGGLRNKYAGGRGDPELRGRTEFRQGPMKGMTMDQARQKFEQMWGSASPAIREKYEKRATVSVGATKPERRESAKDMYARQRESRMSDQAYRVGGKEGLRAYEERKANTTARKPYDKDNNSVPDMIQRPAEVVAKPAAAPVADQVNIGTPEEQARVAGLLAEGEGFQTAGTNDSGMQAAVAMERSMLDPLPWDSVATRGLKKMTRGVGNVIASMSHEEQNRRRNERIAAIRAAEMPASQKASAPAFVGPPAPVPTPASAPMVVAPPVPGSPADPTPGKMPAPGTPVTPGMATDERMHAQGKTNVGGVPIEKKPVDLAARESSAAPVVAKPPRINSLTGLPFGARPGETAGLNPAQRATADRMAVDRAAQGIPVARPSDIAGAQRTMERDGVTAPGSMTYGAPRATPVVVAKPRPTETGGAFGRDAYARTAAAQQTGYEQQAIRAGTASNATRAKHVDYVAKMEADRKMFPPRPVASPVVRKPLDQLVAGYTRPRVMGITRPEFVRH